MRPDYCPMANEPCQSMCDTPCSKHRLHIDLEADTAPQPVIPPGYKLVPVEPSAFGVLFAVEQAIQNGDCPWQIEQAFHEYEAERKNGITKE